MAEFYSILTTVGRARLANAVAFGGSVTLTEMAVGDGNGMDVLPNEAMTGLVNEVYRAGVNSLEVTDETTMRAELVIPTDTGGFYVREVGLFTSSGDLFAVANLPVTYKPVTTEGAGRELKVILLMEISSAESGSITLKIDPTVVLASRDYVDDAVSGHADRTDNPHGVTKEQVGLGNIPNAISDSFNLNNPDCLATAKAVYDAYRALYEAFPGAATTSAPGVVELLTNAEALAGTDQTRAASAANLLAVLNARGLWSHGVLVPKVVNFESLTTPGVFYTQADAANINCPPAGPLCWYVVLVLVGTANALIQIALPLSATNDPRIFFRRKVNTWQTWETLVTNNNGVVSAKASRNTPGTWTLTGLTIGKPVFLTYSSTTNANLYFYYRVLSGAQNSTPNLTSYFSAIGAHNDNTGLSNVGVLIPTDTTVILDVPYVGGVTVTANQ